MAILHVGGAEHSALRRLPRHHRQRQGGLRGLRPHPQQGVQGQAQQRLGDGQDL